LFDRTFGANVTGALADGASSNGPVVWSLLAAVLSLFSSTLSSGSFGCATEGTGAVAGATVAWPACGAARMGARSMTTGPGRSIGAVAFRQLNTAAAMAPCTSTTMAALIVQYRRSGWFVIANAVIANAPLSA